MRDEEKQIETDGRRDLDADWGTKTYKGTRQDGTSWEKVKKWCGYKLHLAVDSADGTSQSPISASTHPDYLLFLPSSPLFPAPPGIGISLEKTFPSLRSKPAHMSTFHPLTDLVLRWAKRAVRADSRSEVEPRDLLCGLYAARDRGEVDGALREVLSSETVPWPAEVQSSFAAASKVLPVDIKIPLSKSARDIIHALHAEDPSLPIDRLVRAIFASSDDAVRRFVLESKGAPSNIVEKTPARETATPRLGVEDMAGTGSRREVADSGRAEPGRGNDAKGSLGLGTTLLLPWKSRPIFISSTFRDMQAERDHLRDVVFPRLNEALRERRVSLDPIDLRQGVETVDVPDEADREHLVLKVCLEAIERSRPFLLVLLGDRYGWIPPEDRLADAAREAGFTGDVAGMSVTALEIEFGVLSASPDQRGRSFFFFREPLSCEDPTYNDALATDAAIRDGHRRLGALKQRILTDPNIAPRVHTYRADWDEKRLRVTGLEAWGEKVFELLWQELDSETSEYSMAVPPTWEEAERLALLEFADDRARGFVGRGRLTREVLDRALEESSQSLESGAGIQGALITGGPGSGKSAFFAQLLHGALGDERALVLAHAAGISPRSASVESMLRRWVKELSDSLGEPDPLAGDASLEDVVQTFYGLLDRRARDRRVVLMVDALNQFSPTLASRHLTWIRPDLWPKSARIIVTTLPCPEAELIKARTAIEVFNLPPLSIDDAGEIASKIFARYHRHHNPEVFKALSAKGEAAIGNPLWLELAIEQINLLDADDFARADRDFAGDPATRLRALLVDMASSLPPDIEGLFEVLLARAEKTQGEEYVRAFALAIALGRTGWRDGDLSVLIPRLVSLLDSRTNDSARGVLTPAEIAPLRLASLRRAFRGQIIRKGALDQLDFHHAKAREAALGRYLRAPDSGRLLHGILGAHLLDLAEDDSLRTREAMHHLAESGDSAKAARYLAGTPESSAARSLAIETLAERILASKVSGGGEELAWTLSMLDSEGLRAEQLEDLCGCFVLDLWDALMKEGGLELCLRFGEAILPVVSRLSSEAPQSSTRKLNLVASYHKLGIIRKDLGDLDGAIVEYRHQVRAIEEILTFDSSPVWRHSLAIALEVLGRSLGIKGDRQGMLEAHRSCHDIRAKLAADNPADAFYQKPLAWSHILMGDEEMDKRDEASAARHYGSAQDIFLRLAREEPENLVRQRDLAVAYNRIGRALVAEHDSHSAAESYRKALEITMRLVDSDPTETEWQSDLANTCHYLASTLLSTGSREEAMETFRRSLVVWEALAASDPSNIEWLDGACTIHLEIADYHKELGNSTEALEALEAASSILDKLLPLDGGNTRFLRLAMRCNKDIAEILSGQGEVERALVSKRSYISNLEAFSAIEPNETKWRLFLAKNHDEIARIMQDKGDLKSALHSFREKSRLMTTVVADDPSDIGNLGYLLSGHFQTHEVLKELGDIAGAIGALRATFETSKVLAAKSPGDRRAQDLPAQLLQMISELE